ncbi:MAG: chemotaxis protein CheA [Deltaproteobacteria bacterium]|nr:chemotaxis protein CheA [Deltaproteobacteria bacterium]
MFPANSPEDATLLLEFIAESLEHLEGIDNELLQYENDPDNKELIDSIFRAIHSIKGTSAFLGLKDINGLAHRLETLLDMLRNGQRNLDEDIMEVLLSGFDLVRALIEELNQKIDQQIESEVEPNDRRIENLLSSLSAYIDEPDPEDAKGEQSKRKRAKPGPTGRDDGYKITEKMIEEFKVEAFEHLEVCNDALIALDKQRDSRDAVNSLFRAIHSVKGTSSYLGLENISGLSHAFEGLLEFLRRRKEFRVADALLDIFFETVDALRAMVEDLDDEKAKETGRKLLESLIHEKEKIQESGGEDLLSEEESVSSTDPNAIFLDAASQHLQTIKACLSKLCENNSPDNSVLDMLFRAVHSLKSSSNYMGIDEIARDAGLIEDLLNDVRQGTLPVGPALTDLTGDLIESIEKNLTCINEDQEREDAHQETNDSTVSKANDVVEPPKQIPESKSSRGKSSASLSTASASISPPKTMRIDQRLLDVFMNLVGELIVARNGLSHVARLLNQDSVHIREVSKDLQKAAQTITRISNEMQRNVMEMRMVPIRNVFQRFPRIVRDLTRKTGKKVNLILQGEETEIDKGIAEDIGDPLVHIIRNAVDHGIEKPDERTKAGKPENGTIILRASHEGNLIVIEVIDDGAGINPDVILKKALEKGLITTEQAEKMGREDVFNLIFLPGFSTAGKITDVSGRGVGMDVVRANLTKLKGNVRVMSDPGNGTHIRLEVPLTLALIEAMLVGVGGETYAVPVESIKETVKIKRSEIKSLMNRKVFSHRGEVIGVEMLSRLLGCSLDRQQEKNGNEVPILILNTGNERLGIAVDGLYRKEEIVIKPLADYLTGIPGLAGASILGDGRTVLILEPGDLLAMATRN